MVKFCKKCGEELDDESIFCDQCGAGVGNVGGQKNTRSDYNPFNLYKIDMIEGEEVLKHAEINPKCLYVPAIMAGIGFMISLIMVIRIFSVSYSYYWSPGFGTFISCFIFNPILIIGLIWLIIRYIIYSHTDLILTNKRVFGKCGVISTTQMQAPLDKINSVSFSNGLIGKLLGYGTVRIATASTKFKFRFILDGQTLYNDMFNHLEIAEKEKMVENAEAIADAIGRRID